MGTKKVLNREKVLELLQIGKSQGKPQSETIKEISQQYDRKVNAIQAHIRRLRLDGKLSSEKVKEIVVEKEIDYDKLIDIMMKKLEHVMELEVENATLKDENNKLKNINAAMQNELTVKHEKDKVKAEAQERLKKIAKGIEDHNIRMTQEAQ